MASFTDLLAQAKAAPRPHTDVDVVLDAGIQEQLDDLDAQIEALNIELARVGDDKRLSDPRPAEIETQVAALDARRDELRAGTLVTLRFTQMRGQEWANITSQCPPRPTSSVDRMYGYNYHLAAKTAAPLSGAVIQDGEPVELTAEQWDELWEVLPGRSFEEIASDIWVLNDAAPRDRVQQAGKASRAGTANKSD